MMLGRYQLQSIVVGNLKPLIQQQLLCHNRRTPSNRLSFRFFRTKGRNVPTFLTKRTNIGLQNTVSSWERHASFGALFIVQIKWKCYVFRGCLCLYLEVDRKGTYSIESVRNIVQVNTSSWDIKPCMFYRLSEEPVVANLKTEAAGTSET